MIAADYVIVVPPSLDEDYIPSIISICRKYNIDLICSLHDLDVFVLSNNRDQLIKTGALPIVPDVQWARICLDKYESNTCLIKHGIGVPWSDVNLVREMNALSLGELRFPIVLKPRFGFGSLGLTFCRSVDELKYQYGFALQHINSNKVDRFFDYPKDQNVLIQQGIEGKEYCVNVVNDLEGQYVCHFASEVLAMRCGETDSVTTTAPEIAGDLPSLGD